MSESSADPRDGAARDVDPRDGAAPEATAPIPGELPDLPAGLAGTDPEAPQAYTPEDVAAASAVLGHAEDGTPEMVVALTDEQLAALDGYERRQFLAMPWLEEHRAQRRFAAAVALRALIAAEQVQLHRDPASGAQRWRAVAEIAGCLVLRRTAGTFVTAERTVQTGQGPEVHRLAYYVHAAGVLEEEVTALGIHRFTALAPALASDRLARFLDPIGAGSAGGDPVRVRTSALPTHPVAGRLASTRALSVLTRVRTADGSVQQLSVYASADGVLMMEALDPASPDPELEIRAVDAAELHALASVLVGGAG